MKNLSDIDTFLNENTDPSVEIPELTPLQMYKFLEWLYVEAQEGVELGEEEGFSSVNFNSWLESDKIDKRIQEIKNMFPA